jgi:hypothetical protein
MYWLKVLFDFSIGLILGIIAIVYIIEPLLRWKGY